MNVPFRINFVISVINCSKYVILQILIQDVGVYLVAGVKNTNSSIIFRVSSVTFPNYCDYIRLT